MIIITAERFTVWILPFSGRWGVSPCPRADDIRPYGAPMRRFCHREEHPDAREACDVPYLVQGPWQSVLSCVALYRRAAARAAPTAWTRRGRISAERGPVSPGRGCGSAGGYYPPLRRQKKLEPLRFRQAWRKLRYSPSFFLSPPKPLCGSGGGPIRVWVRIRGRPHRFRPGIYHFRFRVCNCLEERRRVWSSRSEKRSA